MNKYHSLCGLKANGLIAHWKPCTQDVFEFQPLLELDSPFNKVVKESAYLLII